MVLRAERSQLLPSALSTPRTVFHCVTSSAHWCCLSQDSRPDFCCLQDSRAPLRRFSPTYLKLKSPCSQQTFASWLVISVGTSSAAHAGSSP